MKTTIKSAVLVMAFALVSTGLFANNKMQRDTASNEVSAYVTYSDNLAGVDVKIDKATEGDIMVTIYDAAGNVLLNDKFSNEDDSVKKSYLISDLIDGNYTIAVTTGETVAKKTITLNSENTEEQGYAL